MIMNNLYYVPNILVMKHPILLVLKGFLLLLFSHAAGNAQKGYSEVTVLHAHVMDVGPITFFDEADAMFDKVMRPVILKGNQLHTKTGFVFAKVRKFGKTDSRWLRKHGFTATDDLWIVVPEYINGPTIDFQTLRKGDNGVKLDATVPSMKLSCGTSCDDMDCDEKRCGSMSKRRCISCSGCCKGGSGSSFVGGSVFLIPSYINM